MTTYTMNSIHQFAYKLQPMPKGARYRIGDRVKISDKGICVAQVQVIESDENGYSAKVVNTYGHRRGPSEFKG